MLCLSGSCPGSCPVRVWFVSGVRVWVSVRVRVWFETGFVSGSCPGVWFASGFVSGSCPVRVWFVSGRLVRIWVRVWFVSGFASCSRLVSCLVYVRFVAHSCSVRVRFVSGSCRVRVRFVSSCSCLVRGWLVSGFVSGSYPIRVWFVSGFASGFVFDSCLAFVSDFGMVSCLVTKISEIIFHF